jgi:hypothetical protein
MRQPNPLSIYFPIDVYSINEGRTWRWQKFQLYDIERDELFAP